MSASKRKVLKEYPKSGTQLLTAIDGAKPPFDKLHWRIFREDGEISDTVGFFRIPHAAWADAAEKLYALAMSN